MSLVSVGEFMENWQRWREASGDSSGSAVPLQKRRAYNTRTSSSTKLAVDELIPISEDTSNDTTQTKIDKGRTIQQADKLWNPDVSNRSLRIRARHAPRKPTTVSLLQMIKGPSVEILVGSEKKCFELPKKELLSHYSPVFERCFNGAFIEGQTQKMELPEDTVADFEVLVEYIFHHGFGDELSISKYGKNAIERRLSFLEFADKYDLGDISPILYRSIRDTPVYYGQSIFKPEYIETVFSLTKDGNRLRELMADAVLAFQEDGRRAILDFKIVSFEEQEAKVEGLEAAIYRRLMKKLNCRYDNPFNRENNKYFGGY
ncbi:hypothetical protein NHQ30_002178 [Ciborinia camelliae]|nr:hypothetical protein NHQ30_002178 [Ciborinia camelliae]